MTVTNASPARYSRIVYSLGIGRPARAGPRWIRGRHRAGLLLAYAEFDLLANPNLIIKRLEEKMPDLERV